MNDVPTTVASRYTPPSAPIRIAMFVFALVGLAISGYLLYIGIMNPSTIAGCAPGAGCDKVLRSEWSKIGPLPTAFPAVITYLVALAGLIHIAPGWPRAKQRGAWMILIVVALLLFGAAVWFSYLQYFVIGEFCKFCLAAHVCGVLLAATIFFNAPIGRRRLLPDDPPDPLLIAPAGALAIGFAGLLLVAGTIGAQVALKPATMSIKEVAADAPLPPDTESLTYILVAKPDAETGVEIKLERNEYPVLGDPRATAMIVYLFDYTCPHCREMHERLDELRERRPGRVAVMSLPAPLNVSCNATVGITAPRHQDACDLARIALRVWRSDPDKFAAFDQWLFEPEEPRTAREAEQYARRLLGANEYAIVSDDPWPDMVIERGASIYKLRGGGNLPVLIYRNINTVGSDEAKFEEFAEQLR